MACTVPFGPGTFRTVTLGSYNFSTTPRKMRQQRKYIVRAGLNGAEIKAYGKRPLEYRVQGKYFADDDAALDLLIEALEAEEAQIGDMVHTGGTFPNVELKEVTRGEREAGGQIKLDYQAIFWEVR